MRVHLGRWRWHRVNQLFPDGGRIATLERPGSSVCFIKNGSKSVDVAALGGGVALSLLWRYIEGYKKLLAVECASGRPQHAGNTEIGEHGLAQRIT